MCYPAWQSQIWYHSSTQPGKVRYDITALCNLAEIQHSLRLSKSKEVAADKLNMTEKKSCFGKDRKQRQKELEALERLYRSTGLIFL